MTDLDTSVTRLTTAYADAVRARDVDAFMRLYDPRVRVFDTWGVWEYRDAAHWRTAIESWFTSLGTEQVRVHFADAKTSGTPDFALLTAIVTYAGHSAAGAPLRSMQNRLTWALRTTSHVLRIVHEHTSAPVGFEDQKAILVRPAAT